MNKQEINLPKTTFSMKANLPVKEPELIKYWEKINLYKKLRESSLGKEKFVLHDGPPLLELNLDVDWLSLLMLAFSPYPKINHR